MRDVLPGGSSFGAGQSMVVGTCVEKWRIEGWASNLNHSQNELANGFVRSRSSPAPKPPLAIYVAIEAADGLILQARLHAHSLQGHAMWD